ncbi:hypothetical protein [Alicyclobacillus ferrooxydans]|uniref:hypothetical protein n=1 Tax=Alicyclobacillus ferrooxydans TaxID=471514 RepID=UPI000AFF5CB4|nr:hypothetical protein [Alicyclobacillus ferrooxydans]
MRWTIGLMWFSVILAIGFAILDIIQGHLGGVFFDVFVGMWALWQMERIDRWKRQRRK